MTIRKILLAATVLALPLAAQAQPVTGLYVAGGAGVNWHGNTSGRMATGFDTPASSAGSMRVESSVGFAGVVSVGWGFGNGLRLEVEGSLRHNDVNRVNAVTFDNIIRNPVQARSGYIRTYAVMGNVFYDLRLGPVMPYIGGGVGYAFHRWDRVGARIGANDDVRFSDTSGAFAYQGIVGLAIPIAAVPGLAITGEYRYFASLAQRLNGRYNFESVGPVLGATVKPDNHNHSLLIGVRYNFGRGPAAAPVAAAPAAARSFLVFFDFDRDDLTARGREVIAQAAQASRSQQTTRIEVAGHADRSGTPQYNQGLSQRRANNVAGELVRLGVPRTAIAVAAFGESRPLVPTADGVREPQNRRVEIVLR